MFPLVALTSENMTLELFLEASPISNHMWVGGLYLTTSKRTQVDIGKMFMADAHRFVSTIEMEHHNVKNQLYYVNRQYEFYAGKFFPSQHVEKLTMCSAENSRTTMVNFNITIPAGAAILERDPGLAVEIASELFTLQMPMVVVLDPLSVTDDSFIKAVELDLAPAKALITNMIAKRLSILTKPE